MLTVLHVGCGNKRLDSLPRYFRDGRYKELRLDLDPAVIPDFVGTITDMRAVGDTSVDAVFSSHNLEHIYPHEVPAALREFQRVLRPGGVAVITCPDLQSLGSLLMQGRLTEPAYISGMGPITPLDILYGHGRSLAEGNFYMAHRGGFTLTSLLAALRAAGFSTAVGARYEKTFALWAAAVIGEVSDYEMRAKITKIFP